MIKWIPGFKLTAALVMLFTPGIMSEANGKLKVFILAGQSNMEGRGVTKSRDNLVPGTMLYTVFKNENRADFEHLVDAEGDWIQREDVWVWFHPMNRDLRTGLLSVGFGFFGGTVGPELGFGSQMGEYYQDPVLLIKTAWGATSLAVDWRPPGAGGETGLRYTMMMDTVAMVLDNIKEFFPQYNETAGYELVGFAWHQGWHDRMNADFVAEYATNMEHFIRDVRSHFNNDRLPFTIATTGMKGWDEAGANALDLMEAQFSMADIPDFNGNVKVVETRGFWRPVEESPGTQGYHWNDNAESSYLIGKGLADSLITMLSADTIPDTGIVSLDADRFLDPDTNKPGLHLSVESGYLKDNENKIYNMQGRLISKFNSCEYGPDLCNSRYKHQSTGIYYK